MMEKVNRKYHIMFFIMLLIFAGMISWMAIQYKGDSEVEKSFGEAIVFHQGWTLEAGTEADVKHLNKLDGVKPYQQFSIYHVLPKELEEGNSLFFRSKNIFYQVYLDGELVYQPYVPENKCYNKSFGTRWNIIKLPKEAAGKSVEIRVTTVYDNARAGIDNVYLGDATGIVLHIFKTKIVSFVTCILLLFVGLLLIIADIPINMQKQKNHELMYLGFFAVSIALWCVAETNLFQFFMGDSRLIQIVSCYSLMLIPIPMVLYLNAAFGFKNKYAVAVFSSLSFGEFLVCMGLHFTGIADLHETLKLTHIMLFLSAIIMLYMISRNSFVKGKNQTKNIYRILRGIGLCGISFATVIDIIRFYRGTGNDSAMFVRIGLLIFVLCYGSSSLEKTINAVKLGVKTEFVSQLAYRDGLTGIGNRTAFQEHLLELEKVKDTVASVGVIMFDLNDLKVVNDNMGHHLGDEMLVACGNLIKEAFEQEEGECFRIGGDEFAVLLSGDNVRKRCEEGIAAFEDAKESYNSGEEKAFSISIAYGYAFYDQETNGGKLLDIYRKADMLMYENKKKMKMLLNKQPREKEHLMLE